jgi:hypothetical protein
MHDETTRRRPALVQDDCGSKPKTSYTCAAEKGCLHGAPLGSSDAVGGDNVASDGSEERVG